VVGSQAGRPPSLPLDVIQSEWNPYLKTHPAGLRRKADRPQWMSTTMQKRHWRATWPRSSTRQRQFPNKDRVLGTAFLQALLTLPILPDGREALPQVGRSPPAPGRVWRNEVQGRRARLDSTAGGLSL